MRTVHQRIMEAARLGKGLRLSAADVADLARDHAIVQVAENDDRQRDHDDDRTDAK